MKEYMYRNQLSDVVTTIRNEYSNLNNGNISYDVGENGDTCFELWLEALNNETYNKMFEPIQFIQKGTYVMFRYGRYSDVFGGESEVNYIDFWDSYDGLYRGCRSCVLDLASTPIEYVCLPFDKFFNINEKEETSLSNIKKRIKEAKQVEFSDKLDGSMVTASWYKGNIEIYGSKSMDRNNSWRLDDAFNMFYSNPSYSKLIEENKNITFIFEYISLKDEHVVKYSEDEQGLYLIGMRNKEDGKVYPYSTVIETGEKYKIKHTTTFKKTIDDIMGNLDEKKSYEKEGFVGYIDEFMVKIKYNDYVNLHKVLSNISSINLIISSIANGTYDDVISKVPDVYKPRVTGVRDYVVRWVNKKRKYCEEEYHKIISQFSTTKEQFMYLSEKGRYPKLERGWIASLLKGKKPNYLILDNGRQLKLKEMGVPESEYLTFVKSFKEQEE